MSYMSRYYEEVCQYLQDHPEQARAGQMITLNIETHKGKKEIQHEVTESDLENLGEWTSE